MKAVMYGAGNIGRGFIGQRFYLSGATTTFIDINKDVVDALNAAGEYPIYVTRGEEYVVEMVKNVNAVNGKDEAAVIETIAECDILATALGVNVLNFVAPVLAKAIEVLHARGGRALNILICENLIGSNIYLHDAVAKYIAPELKDYFENMIGFVCVSVGRTVPPTPADILAINPLAVAAEPYSELPVDLSGFRPVGAELPKISEMVPFSPFEFFIERKLLIHNMGHAMMSYLGYLKGQTYIFDTARDGEINYLLVRALVEAGRAVAKIHGADLDYVLKFTEDLMIRFENKLLIDPIERVGRDTIRKLGPNDRLAGAFKAVRKTGGTPAHIAVGIAAGLLFDAQGDAASNEVAAFTRENGVKAALAKYSDITGAADVEMIETFYVMLRDKATFAQIIDKLAVYKG